MIHIRYKATVVAFFLIVEYLSFLFYDFYKNRSRRNRQMVIRMLAGLTGALLVVLEVVRQGPVEIRYLVLDYRKEYDYAKLSDQVTIKLWLADCPLSERISIENTFASRVVFLSSKDLEDCADADIKTAAGSKLWKAVKGTESDTNP